MLGHYSAEQLVALGGLIFLAGFVDALAGGGGLITIPAYLSTGLSPALVLGTNKLSSSIGTAVGTARYVRVLRLELKPFLPMIAASLIGSALGAWLALLVDPSFLRYFLLAALPLLVYFVVSKHHFGRHDRSAELSREALLARQLAIAFPIGCYDGFFGPGTGTFLAVAFGSACRYDLARATASAKVLNLVSNLSALAAFLIAGRVHLGLGAAMGLMGTLGNYAGAEVGVRRGHAAIRPMIIVVCGLLFAKILWDVMPRPWPPAP